MLMCVIDIRQVLKVEVADVVVLEWLIAPTSCYIKTFW
jgi:hypothetical protein